MDKKKELVYETHGGYTAIIRDNELHIITNHKLELKTLNLRLPQKLLNFILLQGRLAPHLKITNNSTECSGEIETLSFKPLDSCGVLVIKNLVYL